MLFKLKYFLASFISTFKSLVKPKTTSGGRVLMFHSISNRQDDGIDHYTVSPEKFARQIAFLKSKNIKFTSFDNFSPSEFSVVLTFDDGYKDNFEIALMLNEQKIPVTIFVVADFVDDSEGRYMTRAQLIKLASLEYVMIGCHGKSHKALTTLSEFEWKKEISESKTIMENIIGKKVTTMSFPHGAYTNPMVEYAKSIGFKKIGTSDIGINLSQTQPIKRIFILKWDNILLFKQKVFGYWDWMSKI